MTLPQARVPGTTGNTGNAGTANTTVTAGSSSGGEKICGNGIPANMTFAQQLQMDIITSITRSPRNLPWYVKYSPVGLPATMLTSAWDLYNAIIAYRNDLRKITVTSLPTEAQTIFGTSIDFSKVLVSSKTGAQNRPFTPTVIIPNILPMGTPVARVITVMHLGISPSVDDWVHELTHVWQSQHHPDPLQYMKSCLGGQAAAVKMNYDLAKTGASSKVTGHSSFPVDYPWSAYAYKTDPSLKFSDFAGEQIAQQVQNGEKTIVDAVKKAPLHSHDADNIASLAHLQSCENRMNAGVRRIGIVSVP